MKIAFRHVPFDEKQRAVITSMVCEAGYEAVWLSDAIPTKEDLADCEALLGYFPPAIFKELPTLKWVQTPAAGVERYCGDLYVNPDVVLTNCSGAFGIAIAEYMFTGLLMLMRLMPAYAKNQKEHIWNCEGTCRSVYGSLITVVGMGDIGTNFAKRAKAFGATVRGVRRTKGECPEYFDEVYTSENLLDAVKDADAVILCLPGTRSTTKMISSEVIAAMKEDAIVVNCGRGYTVDQDALTRALSEGKLAGAVLDVFESEPLPKDHPLWDMENVILTPHISGHDDDPVNIAQIYSIFTTNLKHYFAGEALEHVVDRSLGY